VFLVVLVRVIGITGFLETQWVFLGTLNPLGRHLITKGYGQVLMVFTSVKDRDICVSVFSDYIVNLALMSIFRWHAVLD